MILDGGEDSVQHTLKNEVQKKLGAIKEQFSAILKLFEGKDRKTTREREQPNWGSGIGCCDPKIQKRQCEEIFVGHFGRSEFS